MAFLHNPRSILPALALAGLALTACAAPRPLLAQTAGPASVRGTYTGTFESVDGAQSGRVTFRITSQRARGRGVFALGGTGKFGNYRTQVLQGVYARGQRIMNVALVDRNRNPRLHSLVVTFAADSRTATGTYGIVQGRRPVASGQGNVTVSRR